MRFLIRLLVVFAIVMAVMSALRGLIAPKGSSARKPSVKARSGKLMKDPVCGTYVTREQSLSTSRDSEVFYFCSEDCREKFIASGSQPT